MNESPLQPAARSLSIDAMRGVALLGIFLVNMLSFHSPYFYYDPYAWWKSAEDIQAFSFVDVFVQASFYPLFAALFGIGLAMQAEKAAQRGESYWPVGMRRFGFLLVLGFLHAVLIWPGDILFMYASCGLIMLLLIRLPGKVLLATGLAFWLLPSVAMGGLLFLAALSDPYSVMFWTDIASVSDSIAAYSSGTFQDVTVQRWHDWTRNNIADGAFVFQLTGILPFVMIGAGLYKKNGSGKKPVRSARVFAAASGLFAAGLLLKGIPHLVAPSSTAAIFIQDSLGGPVLAAAYALLVLWLCQKDKTARLLAPVAKAGRLSLTNYLSQSLIGSLLFYSYGLGFYGQIGVGTGIFLCIAIFAVQVMASNAWLNRHSQGPAEKVWRIVTYGRR